jgi:hypothetical protein
MKRIKEKLLKRRQDAEYMEKYFGKKDYLK